MVAARSFHLNFLLQDTKQTISPIQSRKYNAAHGFRIRELEKHVLKCRIYIVAVVNAQINFMRQKNENNDIKQSTIKLSVLLLVNHCKTQPVDRLMSYDEIKDIVQFDPRQTREGRAIMRRALRDLLKDGFVFLVKRGYGIYRAEGIQYRIGGS